MSAPDLLTPLATIDAAKAWLKALNDAGMDFHLEDDPADIIRGSTGRMLFTPEEAVHVQRRVAELYSFDWAEHECPIGYLLHLQGDIRTVFP